MYAERDGYRPLELDVHRAAVDEIGPADGERGDGRHRGERNPLVVYVHGGGWRTSHRSRAPRETRGWDPGFFELLTGKRLFRRDSDIETFESVRQCKVPKPSEVNPTIPAALEKILLKTLARNLDDRYQGAAALAEDLREFAFTHNLRYRGDQLGVWMRKLFNKG